MSSNLPHDTETDFVSNGVAELKRKWSRRGLRNTIQSLEKQRSQAMVALGRQAWEHQVLPPGSETIRDTLRQLTSQSATVSTQQQQTRVDIAVQKDHLQETRTRLDDQLQTAGLSRTRAEAAAGELHRLITEQQAAAASAQSQLSAIANEISMLQQASDSGPETVPEPQLHQLEQEQRQLTEYLTQVSEYLLNVTPQLPPREAQWIAATENEQKIAAERNRVLETEEKKLTELEATLRACTTQQQGLSRNLDEQLLQLGTHIIAAGTENPAIQSEKQDVSQLDNRINATREALSATLQERAAMPRWTMAKFYGVLTAVPILFITLVLVVYLAFVNWDQWGSFNPVPQQARQLEPSSINPYLEHPLKKHLAYRLADKLADAREARNAKETKLGIYRACKAINLGIYFSDGRRVLSGAEQNSHDFFLYEFMRNILADAYTRHTVMTFDAHTRMLAQVLAGTEDTNLFKDPFLEALYQRYADAVAHPDDPDSFVPLLIDGLGRRQALPYSLEELRKRDTGSLEVDDIQSFFLMLDFFTTPPAPRTTWYRNLSDTWMPHVYAGSLCDKIAGKDVKGAWGTGQGVLADLLSQAGGAARTVGETAGKANFIAGLIGDILILRGIQLDIKPTAGVMIDLPHVSNGTDPRNLPTRSFTAVAAFEAELAPEVVECGWMLGKDIPKNGPLKGVEITWDFQPSLSRVHFHDSDEFIANTRMLTNDAGEATVTLRTTPCPEPSGRSLAGQHHRVTASGRFLTAEMPNPLAALGGLSITLPLSMLPGFYEVVTGGRKTYSTLDIGWHEKSPDDHQY